MSTVQLMDLGAQWIALWSNTAARPNLRRSVRRPSSIRLKRWLRPHEETDVTADPNPAPQPFTSGVYTPHLWWPQHHSTTCSALFQKLAL